jgi:hypothetical protein
MPDGVRDEVHRALADHAFTSIVHLVVRTPQGLLLIDPYLDEPALMDDFVFVRDVLAGVGHELVNHWHQFTDRVHERALDELAVGLGRLDELLP